MKEKKEESISLKKDNHASNIIDDLVVLSEIQTMLVFKKNKKTKAKRANQKTSKLNQK